MPLPSSVAARLACVALSLASSLAAAAPTTRPASRPSVDYFDPARHMRTSDVRPGMKGYGLTVLSGAKIESFPIEVISVLHDVFGPQQDVIMIRCTDAFMQHVGPIAGCSGSPIYVYGDDGKARLIGAYALGFDMAKDPIVGVQPIEAMLATLSPPAPDSVHAIASAARVTTWSLLDQLPLAASHKNAIPNATAVAKPQATDDAPKLRPLAIPLAIRGTGAAAIARLAPQFRAVGLEPLAAPATAGGADAATLATATLEPGSVLAGAMLTGDLEMTALGTCTEVINGRAFGFGHPFNGEGPTSVPMCAGAVNLVMPTLQSSFKMGSAGPVLGALDMDAAFGVAGQIGAAAQTFPIAVTVDDATLGTSRTFHYRSATHRMFSPMMAAGAVEASLIAGKPLPIEHTVRYDVTITFEGGRTLALHNVATSLDATDCSRDVGWPVQMMMNNPFANVPVTGVTAHAWITGSVEADEIESAALARTAYAPGETARVLVRVRAYRGDVATRAVDVPVPAALPEGDYPISITDAPGNLAAVAQAEPYRFAVRDVDELFAGLQTIATDSNDAAIYVRLGGTSAGLSIGKTALDRLPPSRRMILQTADRPDTSATIGSTLTVVPGDRAIQGEAQVVLHVKKQLP